MKFPTYAVLSTSTGVLLGDIGGVYGVVSFLIGRDAYTHELAIYGRRASAAIKAALPDLPIAKDAEHVNGGNFRKHLAKWEDRFGAEIELPESLRDCLADDKTALETAQEIFPADKIITINK